MRRPIHLQLLVPTLLIVLLAVGLSSLLGAWWSGRHARRQEQRNLDRVVRTIADAGFPLTPNVLRMLSGLTGDAFVVPGETGVVHSETLPLGDADRATLREWRDADWETLSGEPVLSLNDKRYRVARASLRNRPNGNDALLVLSPEERWQTAVWQSVSPPLLSGAVAGVVAVGLTSVLARRFVRPIRRIRDQALRVADGDFCPIPVPPTDDELRDLTLSLNRMLEQLACYEEQIRRSERLRTLGRLGAAMAHQMRNSVTGAQLALQFHARDCGEPRGQESLAVALRQLSLTGTTLQRFLQLGREQPARMGPVDLGDLIDDTLPLLQPTCRHARVTLEWHPPSSRAVVHGNADALRQLLLNLLLNAIEAATQADGAPGTVRIELEADPPVMLRILDSGHGPRAAVAPRLFEPFVTDKPDGTGLGLAVVRQIAADHRARVGWDRRGTMTCFEVVFDDSLTDRSTGHSARKDA